MKFAAVLIIYNCEKKNFKNIYSYIKYVDKIYVFDNSEKPLSTTYDFFKAITKCEYISYNTNKGISEALNIIAKKAIKEGFIWLLTMDQDSYFNNSGLQGYRYFIENNSTKINKIAMLTPIYNMNNYINTYTENIYEEVRITMTSGSLINLDNFKIIGNFDEKLFIDEVDHEYCFRAIKLGYKILRVCNVILKHKLGERKVKTFLFRNVYYNEHNYIRAYYMIRNKLYIMNKFKLYREYLSHISTDLLRIILLENNKIKKIIYIFKAINDYIFKNYGKIRIGEHRTIWMKKLK